MASKPKKIALIANGLDEGSETLEQILEAQGHQVDVFDVRSAKQDRIDPRGYYVVARVIKGAKSGDTEKSWDLQQFFEQAGAVPHIPIDVAQTVTDKILCREALVRNGIAVSPVVMIAVDSKDDPAVVRENIGQLGLPPYAVRKSLGSGKGCIKIAQSVDEAVQIAEEYKNADVKRGAIIHCLPPVMSSKDAYNRYNIIDIPHVETSPFHFRVVIVDDLVFGTSICFSEKGQFGLNPAQGCRFFPIQPWMLPPGAKGLARNIAAALELKVAAVDICLDENAQPRFLDANASPDLTQVNHYGISLKHAFAESVGNTGDEIAPESQPKPGLD